MSFLPVLRRCKAAARSTSHHIYEQPVAHASSLLGGLCLTTKTAIRQRSGPVWRTVMLHALLRPTDGTFEA